MLEYTSWDQIPDTMCTASQLGKKGLRLTKGQKPVALKTGGYGPYDLYLIADAVPKRRPSVAQLAVLEKARDLKDTFICRVCGERKDKTGSERGRCYDCHLTYLTEQEAASVEEAREVATQWARTILAAGAVILDTETTGLDGSAEIVQIAMIDTGGNTLFDSLVLPSYFPPTYNEAERIHGISQAQLATAPSILTLWPKIQAILDQAPNIVIYNADFDLRLLSQSLAAHQVRLYQPDWRIHCAMEQYAQWWGEYSRRHGSFRWQRLFGGDHSALGDCRATLERLRDMAVSPTPHTYGDPHPMCRSVVMQT